MDITGLLTGPRNYTAHTTLRTLSQDDTERLLTDAGRVRRRDRARTGADRSDPGRRHGDRLAARGRRIGRDRCDAAGSSAATARTARCARRSASRSKGHLSRRVHHGRRRARLGAAAWRAVRVPQSGRDFRGLLDAGREPVPYLRQLPAGSRGPQRRVQRTDPRRVPGDGRRASALPCQGRQGVLGDPLPRAQPRRAPLSRRAGLPRRRRRTRTQPRRGARHEHRHSGRLQPGVEARPGRTRHRRRVVAGQLSGRAAPGRCPAAQDDRPVVLRFRRAQPDWRGSPVAGSPRCSPAVC